MNGQLAKYRSLKTWKAQVGDFVIYHGLFMNRWYGIINEVAKDGHVSVIKDGLPFLLLTTPVDQQQDKTITMPSSKMAGCRAGEFAVLQGDTWYIND